MDKKPLYRFNLDEETGFIKRLEITDYCNVVSYNKREYRYRLNGTVRIVRESSLDRFVHNQVHTFDPDIENARKIMVSDLSIKARKAQKEYIRYTSLRNKLYGEVKPIWDGQEEQ